MLRRRSFAGVRRQISAGIVARAHLFRWLGLAFGFFAVAFVAVHLGRPAQARTWSFEEPAVDPASLGFDLSPLEAGEWQLVEHRGASGDRALVSRAGHSSVVSASAVVADSITRDLEASTRCHASESSDERGCG